MLKIYLEGHNYEYAIRELTRLFFRDSSFKICTGQLITGKNTNYKNKDYIVNKLTISRKEIIAVSKGTIDGKNKTIKKSMVVTGDQHYYKREIKRLLKSTLYELLVFYKGWCMPWGILVGIRPTKIVHDLIGRGRSNKEIINILQDKYYISLDKAKLLLEVGGREYKYIYPIDENKISLYISIPFCPSRCNYCSFPSNLIGEYQGYINSYVESLCWEIREISKILRDRQVESIYIGGGTPTTLTIDGFDLIFNAIFANLNVSKIKEFTVEAGRPDTIDKEKLRYFKINGVTRISINPQTMHDSTLKKIGRKHTTQELLEAFYLTKEIGLQDINMDIIVGLPGEDSNMVGKTIKELMLLAPTSLTVHTLAIKTSSVLKRKNYALEKKNNDIKMILKMLENYIRGMNYRPYYLYRQKNMVANFENMGYAKPGYECIYNMQTMGEKQTIIAVGAGGVSKIVYPNENRLQRVPNVKNVMEYIQRVDEMVGRKKNAIFGGIEDGNY